MKLTFDEEGVSDSNGNCVVPKISAKFLKAAQKEAFRCYLSQKKLHGVFSKQRDGIQNSPIPGCQMVETEGLVVTAKDSLGPIRYEFSSNGTRALPCSDVRDCHQMSRLSFGCPRSGDSMGIPHGVSHCGHEHIPGMVPHGATLCVLCLKCPPVLGDIPGHPEDGPTWGYPMCPMSQVSQYLGTSQDIPGMVPHGATLCVLCLKCPSTWRHPRTSRGWSLMGLPRIHSILLAGRDC